MEGGPRGSSRDINELLTTGYFKTARGKSPGPASDASSFLRPVEHDAPRQRSRSRSRGAYDEPREPFLGSGREVPRERSRSRGAYDAPREQHRSSGRQDVPRERSRARYDAPSEQSRSSGRYDTPRARSRSRMPYKAPPRPTVEDEEVSLNRESSASRNISRQSYDPPLRGIMDQNPIILEADVDREEAARLQKIPCAKDGDEGRRERKDSNPERRFVLIPKSDTYDPNEESEVEAGSGRKGHSRSSNDGSEGRRSENGHKMPAGGSDTRRGENVSRSSNDHARTVDKGHKYQNSGSEDKRRGRTSQSSNAQAEPKRGEKGYRSPKESESRSSNEDFHYTYLKDGAGAGRSRPPNSDLRQDDRKEPTKLDRPTKEVRRTSYRGEALRVDERRQPERPNTERRRSRQDLPTIETKIPREIPPQFRRSVSAMSNFADSPSKVSFGKPATPAEIFLSPEALRPAKDFHPLHQSTSRGNVHEALWGKAPTLSDVQRSANILHSQPGTPSSEKRIYPNSENGARPPAEKLTRPQQLAGETVGRQQERRRSPAKSTRSSTHSVYDHSGSEEDSLESDSDHRRRRGRKHRDERKRRSPSRSNRSSLDVKSASRFSSPLPSPKVSPSQTPTGERYERAEGFPPGRNDKIPRSRPVSPFSAENMNRTIPVNNANPGSRQDSTNHGNKPSVPFVALGIVPVPNTVPNPSRDTGRAPAIPPYEENRPLGPRPIPQTPIQSQQKPFWQPPSFQPPPQNAEKPMGSFRRFSEDVERGQSAPLPVCSRTKLSKGRNDWLTLPQISPFDICRQCFLTTIAPTQHRDLFIPARRPSDESFLCDFGSSPWYRIAWLLTLKDKRHDLSLFYDLADIAAKYEPCKGSKLCQRQWYSVKDPRTGGHVKDFDVCISCVKNVEVLLPAVRGVFIPTKAHAAGLPLRCDLRFDSKRFVLYFDALETIADRTTKYVAPDTRDMVRLCRKFATIPECERDLDLTLANWHTITQLPEFTVCEDCFDEVVGPELDDGQAIAKMFSRGTRQLPNASCQLYGGKMRSVFRTAVDSDDYRYLATKARERKNAEYEYKRAIDEMGRHAPGNPGIEREIKRRREEWSFWE